MTNVYRRMHICLHRCDALFCTTCVILCVLLVLLSCIVQDSEYIQTPVEEQTSKIISQLAKMQETLNTLSERLDNFDRRGRDQKTHHYDYDTGIHADEQLQGPMEEGEEEESGLLQELDVSVEEEATVAESVL